MSSAFRSTGKGPIKGKDEIGVSSASHAWCFDCLVGEVGIAEVGV